MTMPYGAPSVSSTPVSAEAIPVSAVAGSWPQGRVMTPLASPPAYPAIATCKQHDGNKPAAAMLHDVHSRRGPTRCTLPQRLRVQRGLSRGVQPESAASESVIG